MVLHRYNPKTGEILETYIVDDNDTVIWKIAHQQGYVLAYGLEGGSDDSNAYVDVTASPPITKFKPAQATTQDRVIITANGEDYFTLAGLPVPCIVSVNDKTYTVNDGVFEWATLRPGVYRVLVSAFPYLDYEGQVIAE